MEKLIAKPEYAGITYEYLEGPSPEICTVILNYPGTVHLTGQVKKASFEEGSRFWQCLDLSSKDKDTHFPQVLYIYEKDVVGDLKCRQLTHGGPQMARRSRTRRSVNGQK